jgi:hypothetical protein
VRFQPALLQFRALTWMTSQPKDEGYHRAGGARSTASYAVDWLRVDPTASHSFKLASFRRETASSGRGRSPMIVNRGMTASPLPRPRKPNRDVPFPLNQSFSLSGPRQARWRVLIGVKKDTGSEAASTFLVANARSAAVRAPLSSHAARRYYKAAQPPLTLDFSFLPQLPS